MPNKPLCREEEEWNNGTTGDWYGRTKSEMYGTWPGRERLLRERAEKERKEAEERAIVDNRNEDERNDEKTSPAYYQQMLEPELPVEFIRACAIRDSTTIFDFDSMSTKEFGWATPTGRLLGTGFESGMWDEYPSYKHERAITVSIDEVVFTRSCPVDFPLHIELMVGGYLVLKSSEQVIPAGTHYLKRNRGVLSGFEIIHLDEKVFRNAGQIYARVTTPLISVGTPAYFHRSIGDTGNLTVRLTMLYKNN